MIFPFISPYLTVQTIFMELSIYRFQTSQHIKALVDDYAMQPLQVTIVGSLMVKVEVYLELSWAEFCFRIHFSLWLWMQGMKLLQSMHTLRQQKQTYSNYVWNWNDFSLVQQCASNAECATQWGGNGKLWVKGSGITNRAGYRGCRGKGGTVLLISHALLLVSFFSVSLGTQPIDHNLLQTKNGDLRV